VSKLSPLSSPTADIGLDIEIRRCGPEAVMARAYSITERFP
jgi:hypothetical protein